MVRALHVRRPWLLLVTVLAALAVAVGVVAQPATGPYPVAGTIANLPAPGDAPDSLRAPATRDRFYFLLPDRFSNADPDNDRGGLTGPREVTGFDPTGAAWFHGGDLKGTTEKLDYIRGLGTSALWLTPVFANMPVQGLGTPYPGAGYHGYWILDFTRVDPHLGTDADLRELITQAHARGMKVYFDIVVNHTADVIQPAQKPGGPAPAGYVLKKDVPYVDADGNAFDDRDFLGSAQFPSLVADRSFPYAPEVAAGQENLKGPAWLNDVTAYHNRGNTTYSGESNTYGDFAGLDDLFTEQPRVVSGMEQIFDGWITDYGIDGFRIDTMKYVDLEFWQQFLPHILATAKAAGKPEFFAFGEVYDLLSNPYLSRYTTAGKSQAVLDFTFQQQARAFGASGPTDALRTLFDDDDWFTDADSNAYGLPTFLGNHDMGHIGAFLRDDNPTASKAELLARDQLVHALLFTSRGNPVVYYGDEQGFTGAPGGDKAGRQDMFPSKDPDYDNQGDDAGLNDDIGSDQTPADDNFDPNHPLYRTIATLSRLRETTPALADGVQQVRASSSVPGILAYSRTDATDRIEYVVVLNNATAAASARIPTYSAGMGFDRIWGADQAPPSLTSGGDRAVDVRLPALSAAVYR
ncbi:alpha-amylase family glycosyl hydrolase, partial [Microlunatus ginsengisoli]